MAKGSRENNSMRRNTNHADSGRLSVSREYEASLDRQLDRAKIRIEELEYQISSKEYDIEIKGERDYINAISSLLKENSRLNSIIETKDLDNE